MESLLFDLGTKTLKLSTPDRVKLHKWEELYNQIGLEIENLYRKLDSTNTGSDTSLFNNLPPDVSTEMSTELFNYLKVIIQLSQDTNGLYHPTDVTGELNLSRVINISASEVRKLQDIKISNELLNLYIVDFVDRILERSTIIDNYFLTFSGSYVGRGNLSWEISFPHPIRDELLQAHIADGALSSDFVLTKPSALHASTNPFSGGGNNLIAAVVKAEDVLSSYVMTKLILASGHELNARRLAKWNKDSVYIIDQTGEIIQINPLLQDNPSQL